MRGDRRCEGTADGWEPPFEEDRRCLGSDSLSRVHIEKEKEDVDNFMKSVSEKTKNNNETNVEICFTNL